MQRLFFFQHHLLKLFEGLDQDMLFFLLRMRLKKFTLQYRCIFCCFLYYFEYLLERI